MTKHVLKRVFWIAFVLIIAATSALAPLKNLLTLPSSVMMTTGTGGHVDVSIPALATIETTRNDVVSVTRHRIASLHEGIADVNLKLLGFVPFKSLHVNVLPPMKVYPGGQSIGVKLHARGILVVGYHLVHVGNHVVSPAEQANVRIGDMIVKMDGHNVTTVENASQWIRDAGEHHRPLQMTLMRKHESVQCAVIPLQDASSHTYRIGLYIRDSAAGVGTLTFYEPSHHAFGALGHVISDTDTGQPFHGDGQIIHSTVTSIDKGSSGQPGEKRGVFVNETQSLGQVTKNSPFGVFGQMPNKPDNLFIRRPIPIALADQVHVGPAKILTVLSGQRVQAFNVEIARVVRQTEPGIKSMVIKVTDPVLLEKTGGIVQGMSGSPILQDGMLVGAVTHVFVSDPTQGYGVYIEWMLNDAGIQTRPKQEIVKAPKSVASSGLFYQRGRLQSQRAHTLESRTM